MARIHLAVDIPCMSNPPGKIEKDAMGGAERFFLLLEKWLVKYGHEVNRWPEPVGTEEYDLCIHSNVFNVDIKAKKHILWGGSWHVSNYKGMADVTILLSEFIKTAMDWPEAIVLPAPWDTDLLEYKCDDFIQRRIVCNANPNRHYNWMVAICEQLEKIEPDFDWHICGGSPLYNTNYPDIYPLATGHPKVHWGGLMPRKDMLKMLAVGHLYVYPNFSDGCETQGVSFLECAALGMPIILPPRQPFLEVLPEATFAPTVEAMVSEILKVFESKERKPLDVSRYSADVLMPKFMKIVEETL